jgi:phage tail-like protein
MTQIQSQYNSSLATDPLRLFRFNATFSPAEGKTMFNKGLTNWAMGFTSISGLSATVQNIEYREGGMNTTVHQVPGMTTFQPIVFSRGVVAGNDQGMTWMRGLFGAALGSGLGLAAAASQFRMDIVITVNSHPNADSKVSQPAMAFKVHNAWITNLQYSDLDATQGAILFERITVIHEGISVLFTDPTQESVTPKAGVTGAALSTVDYY